MYKRFWLFLTLLISINAVAQEKTQWVTLLDSMQNEKDFNKKKFQLNQIADEIIQQWKQSSIDEIKSLSNKLSIAKSEDGKIGVIVYWAITYANTLQIDWLVKEDFTGNGKIWHFKKEVKVKPSKTYPKLFATIVDDNINQFYNLTISNHAGRVYVTTEDLLTNCWFENLFIQESDAAKDSINSILLGRLNKLWKNPGLFESELTGLNRMKTILSDDKKVKISTYNIEKEGFKHEFYGAVLTKTQGVVKVYNLTDASDDIRSPERASLNEKKWYGAIYLDIIEAKYKDKTYYTLIGYKGHDEFVKTRLLDVLIIQNNRLRFGVPVFKEDRLTRNRMIYQYSAGATMMMRYDDKMKMIVMDNLVPTESFYKGVYRFYGPDFSYNGFKFQKGHWEFIEEIDLRNPKINH
ncbi:hypothetical protein [Carboxylicivirga linearis]|uniref:Uncharacterized protein n=1 Tax=Carboxylicivirga linearis TaxID=1628157 RepID=A0ABS5JSA3_9BACT|nr:hypothetical protein [Carboxylicivirga linearis]MBS2097744.1 hypothetical protein [Carboxylicivirga linearis]